MSWDQPISSEELQGMYDRALAWHGMPSMGPNQSWDEYLQALAQPRQGVEYYPATYFRQQNALNSDYERLRQQGIGHEQAAIEASRGGGMSGGMPSTSFDPPLFRVSGPTRESYVAPRDEAEWARYRAQGSGGGYDSRMREGWAKHGGQANVNWDPRFKGLEAVESRWQPMAGDRWKARGGGW